MKQVDIPKQKSKAIKQGNYAVIMQGNEASQ